MSSRTRQRLAAVLGLGVAAAGLQLVSAPLAPAVAAEGVQDIQVLATNDFHGRIQNDQGIASAGAAVLAGAVKQFRAANPNTVFAAAGDLIGASTFESFIQNDKPTIDALNEAGLEVSAVGNHELDQGYDDLVDRVMATYDAESNPEGGAGWQYLAANLKIKATGDPAVPATWVKTMSGVDVGFVGAVTEDLPSLVSPDGIAELDVAPVVSSVNAAAADLQAAGADVVVMLVHEGAPTTTCATMATGAGTWASIVNGVSDDVDAIVSGHTHLGYNCSLPVAGWSDRPVTERPVVSAGQYGTNLNQLVFSVDTATGEVVAKTQALLPLESCGNSINCTSNYPADQATADIVAAAVAEADVLGAQKVGEIGSSFSRAKLDNGTTENRGGESTLGNLVAEVQRWATSAPESGAAQIALMNPGGMRADLPGTGTGPFPRDVTYRQAAIVQPFANTLVNMDLTGAQIETVLEQQWQRDASNRLPPRQFLKLGTSAGFTYTYSTRTVTETPTDGSPAYQAPKGEVTGMWLDGQPITPTQTLSVTVNSFLATGGDNFRELANGTGKQDTGRTDLEAMVDYMAAAGGPVVADPTQHAVGVSFPADAPASYTVGDEVAFTATSLAYTAPGDPKDLNVTVWLGNEPLRTIAVNNVQSNDFYDETGTAPVTFVVPPGTPAGPTEFRLVGNQTGTEVPVTIDIEQQPALTAGDATITWGETASIEVAVTGSAGAGTGTVEILDGETSLGSAVLEDGTATIVLPAGSVEPGVHPLTAAYSGATYPELTDELVLTVEKASTMLSADDVSTVWGTPVTVTVALDDERATGAVELKDGATVLASANAVDGVATLTLPAASLEPGVRTLTASYAGSGRFEPATTTVEVEVRKAAAKLSAGDVSTVWGTPATVTVTLDDDRATGAVELRDGSTPLASANAVDGVATLTLPAASLEPGVRTLTAAYAGSGRFEPATTTVRVEVRKATTTLSAGDVSLDYGTAATVTVVLDKRATGTVELADGSTLLATASAVDGVATLTLPAGSLRPGTTTLTAAYAGSGRFQSASTTLVAEVDKAASTTRVRIKQDRVVVSRTRATVKIAVLGDHGVEANGKVRIAVSGQAATTVRLDEGSFTLRLDEFDRTGKKTVTVRYLGSNLLERSDDTVSFRVVRS